MGLYTPAVIVHDMAPSYIIQEIDAARHDKADHWIRALHYSMGELRLVLCSTSPTEIPRNGLRYADQNTLTIVRRMALTEARAARIAKISGVEKDKVVEVLKAIMSNENIYKGLRKW